MLMMMGFILTEHLQEKVASLVVYYELQMVKRNKLNIFPNQATNIVDTFKNTIP